jgi:malate dehydrogenase (oxaloacetate-decarboxylating)(NADP+)
MWEASAVAATAVAEGKVSPEVAASFNIDNYRNELESRLGLTRSIMRGVMDRAARNQQRIVFCEGDHPTMLKAAAQCIQERICKPVLLGRIHEIEAMKEELGLEFECEMIDPREDSRRSTTYTDALHRKRGRKGVTRPDAKRLLKSRTYFGPMMVELGDADGIIGGIARNYPDFLRPCLETIGTDENAHRVIGTYMMTIKGKLMFIGDATINIYPDKRTLAEIAIQTARVAKRFGVEPRVALLSFSNFGSSGEFRTDRIEDSLSIARELDPSLIIDGPMQADTALIPDIQEDYPFMTLNGPANVLICPNLASANISYKLLQRLGGAEMTGPILEGMAKPVHVLQRGDAVRDVVHMAAICAVDAQRNARQRL